MSKNFKYLDELIQSGENEIILDYDIILSEEDESRFLKGIKLDNENLVINGNGHTIDAKGKARIFTIIGYNITFKNLKFKNAYSSEDGGAISQENGYLEIQNCEFENNVSYGDGGAIFCGWSSDLKISQTKFEKNNANDGGAINNLNGKVFIDESEFNYNTSQNSGGTISNQGYGILEILNTKFLDNYAEKNGGAIINFGEININKSRFINNSTKNDGGAINNQRHALIDITSSKFYKNNAEKYGGAIINFGEININKSRFINNSTKNDGGAISNQNMGSLKILSTIFEENYAEIVGGAIINFGGIYLKDSKFIKNKTEISGGAINNQNGNLEIDNAIFANNKSEKNGGAIINWKNINIKNSYFKDNSTRTDGGAIICKEGSKNLISTTEFIKNNGLLGCSISNYSEDIKINNCKFLQHNTNSVILNKNSLNIYESLFQDNCTSTIIINDENSKLNISGGNIINNDSIEGCIKNIGKYCSISSTTFENNPVDVINETILSLKEPRFKTNKKTILNNGHIDIRKLTNEEIVLNINNCGTIDRFEIPTDLTYDFNYLNNKIHESQHVKLKNDITLENYELDFFEGGIVLDIDNLIIDGNGKTIDGRNKTRIFTITGKNITLKNIIFKNGFVLNEFNEHTTGGGAIRCVKGSFVKIENCKFLENCCEGDGGAILSSGKLISTDCEFGNNHSKNFGGAIYNKNKLKIHNNVFTNNKSQIGAIIYNDGYLNIEKIKLLNNTSDFNQEIYNLKIINTMDEGIKKIIYNTGEINPKTKDSKSFNYLKEEINNSNQIFLQHDIIYDYKKDEMLQNGMEITKDMIIDGNGHSIDGKHTSSLFHIHNHKVILKNITIKNCYSQKQAIIENKGILIFENCKFVNNKIGIGSNLINNDNALKIENSNFSNNSSKNQSLINNNGELELICSGFVNNDSNTNGTIVYNLKKVTVNNSNFKNNRTKIRGGIFYNVEKAIINISNCIFTNNMSKIGGGVLLNFGKIIFDDCKLISNLSNNNGGALNNQVTGKIKATNTEFTKNKSLFGGAIWTCYEEDLTLINCKFKDNIPDDIFEN